MPTEIGSNDNLVEVHELCKSYGSLRALDGVSFSVKRGEVFGILGPNGAGKTTTVEILEGMRLPDSGVARINGIDIRKDARSVKSLIGIQLQSSSFFEKLNLTELLEVFGSLYRRRVDAKALLREVELDDKAKSDFKELSGGQKQRFSIATTLVNDPLLLFLDEPTTGLNPQARRHLWELVKRFKTEGRTVLMPPTTWRKRRSCATGWLSWTRAVSWPWPPRTA
jgi:ABC-2 type transport system ATP-binding protein